MAKKISQTPQIKAQVARLEKAYWQAVIPRLVAYVRENRQPLNSPAMLEATRRIGDETAREIFSAAMADKANGVARIR